MPPVGEWLTASHPLYQHLAADGASPFMPAIARVNALTRASVHALASAPHGDAKTIAFVDCGHAIDSNGTWSGVAAGVMHYDRVHLAAGGYRRLAHCLERPLRHLDNTTAAAARHG